MSAVRNQHARVRLCYWRTWLYEMQQGAAAINSVRKEIDGGSAIAQMSDSKKWRRGGFRRYKLKK